MLKDNDVLKLMGVYWAAESEPTNKGFRLWLQERGEFYAPTKFQTTDYWWSGNYVRLCKSPKAKLGAAAQDELFGFALPNAWAIPDGKGGHVTRTNPTLREIEEFKNGLEAQAKADLQRAKHVELFLADCIDTLTAASILDYWDVDLNSIRELADGTAA